MITVNQNALKIETQTSRSSTSHSSEEGSFAGIFQSSFKNPQTVICSTLAGSELAWKKNQAGQLIGKASEKQTVLNEAVNLKGKLLNLARKGGK